MGDLSTSPLTSAGREADHDLLQTIAAGTAGHVGEAFFRSLCRHLASAYGADVAFVAERLEQRPGWARVLASWAAGDAVLPEGIEFELEGTPCSLVPELEVVNLPHGTVARFPGDRFVARYRLDGYLAVALRAADGALLGHIGVASRRALEPDEADVVALRIFAARAAAEIDRRRHEAALREREAEVAAAHTRVVQAADEERKRIGRDLHDGVQQRLVALELLVGLAERKLSAGSADGAKEILEQVHEQASTVNQELRELARGLHPAGLSEHGLAPALEALGERSTLPVRVVALPERRLPEPVEVTIYYLVSEALTNAVKHAGASELAVTVTLGGRTVVAEVADDGCGGADPAAGGGLLGLRDRVSALCGAFDVTSPASEGTRLRARIPLAAWRTTREPFLEFGYDGDDGLGERAIEQVLTGEKTVAVSVAREWDPGRRAAADRAAASGDGRGGPPEGHGRGRAHHIGDVRVDRR